MDAGIVTAMAVGAWAVLFDPLSPLPALARDLPSEFRAADTLFKEQVAREFPLPICEDQLVAELESQGFEVVPERATAEFSRQSFPCRLRWRISWAADQAEVQSIFARYGGACL